MAQFQDLIDRQPPSLCPVPFEFSQWLLMLKNKIFEFGLLFMETKTFRGHIFLARLPPSTTQ